MIVGVIFYILWLPSLEWRAPGFFIDRLCYTVKWVLFGSELLNKHVIVHWTIFSRFVRLNVLPTHFTWCCFHWNSVVYNYVFIYWILNVSFQLDQFRRKTKQTEIYQNRRELYIFNTVIHNTHDYGSNFCYISLKKGTHCSTHFLIKLDTWYIDLDPYMTLSMTLFKIRFVKTT